VSVDYHGWTHLPKAQGGTDPIPVQNPALRAVSDSAIFATPTVFTDGMLGDLVWKNYESTNEAVLVANTLIGSDLYIFEGKIRGSYDVKIAAAVIPDSGVTIEKVGFRFLIEYVGGGTPGAALYDETMVHPSVVTFDGYYLFTTIVDVPPYDPEDTVIDSSDPPTGWLGYAQMVVDTDGGDALLKEARLSVYYRGAIG
jgi:hypothetical protein